MARCSKGSDGEVGEPIRTSRKNKMILLYFFVLFNGNLECYYNYRKERKRYYTILEHPYLKETRLNFY